MGLGLFREKVIHVQYWVAYTCIPNTIRSRYIYIFCMLVVKYEICIYSLPAAVQFALFSELTRKYPLRGVSLANEGSDVVMAHVIYNQWVIRFVQQNMKYSSPPPRPPISATVEVTCSPPGQILNIVNKCMSIYLVRGCTLLLFQ